MWSALPTARARGRLAAEVLHAALSPAGPCAAAPRTRRLHGHAAVVLIRCGCGRLQAEGPQCVACGAALPVIERLDGRAVRLRENAVVQLLTPEEQRALAVIVSGLGLVSGWWRVRAVHDVFVLLAGQRRV